jgi:hypothetical protein
MTILAGMILVFIIMLGLNHYFYMRRRLTDLRLEAIHEVNWLLAQFLTNWLADRDYVASEDFLHTFRAATSKTWALFSDTSCQTFRRIEAMVEPALGRPGDMRDANTFLEAQDAALRALYKEAGLKVPRSLQPRSWREGGGSPPVEGDPRQTTATASRLGERS